MTEISKPDLDRLTWDIGKIVTAYLGTPPPSPARCFTVLNAVAILISPVLARAPDHVREWFDDVVTEAIDDMRGLANGREENRPS